MHGSLNAFPLEALTFDQIVRLDRALRRARERVLAFGKLCDPLWSILLELAASSDGLSFEALETGATASHGRTALLACLSTLEEAGLVDGEDGSGLPLLAHVRITAPGRERISAVLAATLAEFRAS